MKPSTLVAKIVAVDKVSAVFSKINRAAKQMTGTIKKESAIAGQSFTKFSDKVGLAVKKVTVSLNTLNAKVNRVGRNIKKSLGTFGLAVGFTALTMAAGNTIGVFADYEQANAGLTAVMGTTLEQNEALIVDSKRLGAVTAKTATEVVGLQEAYARLGFGQDSIINMTEATISGSVAMKGELADTAELVGAMVKSFDDFDSVDAPSIIDKLTKSTQMSALNFEKLQTGLPIVAGAANAAKVPFTKLLASMGKLSDAGIDASSSTTALRNIYLEAAKQGVPYETLIKKVANSTDQLATANELFGKRGAVAAVILAKNISKVGELDRALQSAGGTAATAAAKQLDTFKGSLTILGSAWEGYILSVEDGTGALGNFLKTSTRVITDILSIATGTEKAKNQLTDAELRIRNLAESGIKLLKVLKWIVGAFVAFKIAVFALNTVTRVLIATQKVWQTMQAVSLALQGKTLLFLQGNTAATIIYNTAMKAAAIGTKIWAIAQAGFNAVMSLNPLGLVIIAVFALIPAIVLLVRNWDAVSAAIQRTWQIVKTGIIDGFVKAKEVLTGFYDKMRNNPIFALLGQPIIFVVEAVKLLISSFSKIKDAFKFGGMIAGFKEIGKTIINFMILPFKIFLEALSKIPKVGKFAQVAVDKINNFQNQDSEIIQKKTESQANDRIKQKELSKQQSIQGEKSTSNITTNSFFNNINQGRFSEQAVSKSNADKEIKQKETNDMKKLVDSLNANSNATNENSNVQKAGKNEWKGKFLTTIIKDANVSDRVTDFAKSSIMNKENISNKLATNDIAKTAILKEENIINTQKQVIKEKNITNSISNESFTERIPQKQVSSSNEIITKNSPSQSSPRGENQEIIIKVVDNTGDNYGIEVESTGINVITTGNA